MDESCFQLLLHTPPLSELVSPCIFDLGLFPVDRDVMSMESDDAFRDIFIWHDDAAIDGVARSLMQLQMLCGDFHKIMYKGHISQKIAAALHRRYKQTTGHGGSLKRHVAQIDEILIVDRDVDFVSPQLKGLSYASAMADHLGIENGMFVEVRKKNHLFNCIHFAQANDVSATWLCRCLRVLARSNWFRTVKFPSSICPPPTSTMTRIKTCTSGRFVKPTRFIFS